MSDIREALTAAIQTTQAAEPSTEATTSADASSVEAAPQATEAAPVEASPTLSKARDGSGRFVPKAEVAPADVKPKAPAVVTPKAAPTVETTPASTSAPDAPKAPQSWTPAAREEWSKLPPRAQAEIARRESEIAREIQASSAAKKFAQEFTATVSPFMGMIQAEGGDVMGHVGNLLRTAQALRTAPPVQRAALVADLVKTFGVPIDALDAALAGAAPPQGAQPGPYKDPRVDQLFATLENAQRQRAQAVHESARSEAEAFAAKAEFFEDVRQDVADLLEMAARRGQALTLQDAYDRVVRMHPEISGIVAQREAAAKAKEQQAAMAKTRNAASSVRSSPSAAPAGKEKLGLREQLEAAAAAHLR